MTQQFKPSGYNALSPYFIVDGAQRLIELLKKIFKVEELRRYDNEDGSIMHSEIRIEDTVVMIADSSKIYPANQFLVHVYVEDVDHIFKKAIDNGFEAVEEPVNKGGDIDKRGMFKDFQGNIWAVATQTG